jgi:hypothetical protein
MIRPVSASRYLRGLLAPLIPLRPELLIRVPRLGRWFVLVAMEVPVLGGLLVSEAEVDVEVLDEDGKIGLEVLSRFEEVRLGMDGAAPLPKPSDLRFLWCSRTEIQLLLDHSSCFDDGPVPVLVL